LVSSSFVLVVLSVGLNSIPTALLSWNFPFPPYPNPVGWGVFCFLSKIGTGATRFFFRVLLCVPPAFLFGSLLSFSKDVFFSQKSPFPLLRLELLSRLGLVSLGKGSKSREMSPQIFTSSLRPPFSGLDRYRCEGKKSNLFS